jgi:glycosyltransferase involved in cell wall biosynthesis
MRIGIDASRAVVRPRTGTENYSYHLIREMLALDRAHDYTLYFNQPPPLGDFPAGSATQRVIPFPRLWTHLRLSAEMASHSPDVLFVPSHVLPVVHPERSVATVHDLGYLYWPKAHPLARRWYLYLSTLFNARSSSRVIADSQATADDLARHCRIPREKIAVIHLGCGPEYRPPSAEAVAAVRSRYALPGRYVLTLGTIQPRKNLGRLVEAFGRVRQATGDVVLVLVGKPGWGAAPILRQIAASGSTVRILGYVPDRDLPALLGGAEALAFPSLYEGFGLPALEAMACGTPVVCSNNSSLPEIVGDAGLLVKPTDVDAIAGALILLLEDGALRAELRRRGLEQAATFSWTRCAAETLDLLESA